MAITEADIIEIGKRYGIPEEEATRFFNKFMEGRNAMQAALGSRNKAQAALGSQGISDELAKDELAKEHIDLVFRRLAETRASSPTKKKGLFSKIFGK